MEGNGGGMDLGEWLEGLVGGETAVEMYCVREEQKTRKEKNNTKEYKPKKRVMAPFQRQKKFQQDKV